MTTDSQNDDGTVHIGKDGYLFLSGGQHGVFSYFSGDRDPAPGSVETFHRNHAERAAYCAATGRTFRTMVFPEKCVVLRDRVATDLGLSSLFQRCYLPGVPETSGAPAILYPLAALQDCPTPFSRTDTHYAARGNIAVTQALTGDLFPRQQAAFEERCLALLTRRSEMSGDLGRKFTPPLTEEVESFSARPTPVRIADNGMVGGNDGIMLLVVSPESLSKKTLLIFGDSFYRQLLPFLAVFYRRIVFCRTRFFHYEMIEAFRPDHVFCGCAERYLSKALPDDERPHFLSYPLMLGRPIAPDENFPAFWKKFVDRHALFKDGL